MGLGDEIMALGRAERHFEQTGIACAIVGQLGEVRRHDAWLKNPAVDSLSSHHIMDGAGYRPYIQHWHGKQIIFNMDYRPRAGRVVLSDEDRASCTLRAPYAIVAPHLKKEASPNKDWGYKRWEQVIADFPIPVYQLVENDSAIVIQGAIPYHTPSWQKALAAIERAALVMCNEGGSHHMAASVGTPAVVIFGSFVPPDVTGYAIHHNIAVETEHGFCGNWKPCDDCKRAMAEISPAMVREKALLLWESWDAD